MGARWHLLVALLVTACAKSGAADGASAASSSSSGTGGAADQGCPKDLLAAKGTACAPDGKTCGTSTAGFTHFLMCSRGKWTEMEAPPPPPPPPPQH